MKKAEGQRQKEKIIHTEAGDMHCDCFIYISVCFFPYTYMHACTHIYIHIPAKERNARRCFPFRLETNASAEPSSSSVAPSSSPSSLPSSAAAAAKRGDNGCPCLLLLTARQIVSVNIYI
jgi:hypothetical protein